jgi:hypothetical protein
VQGAKAGDLDARGASQSLRAACLLPALRIPITNRDAEDVTQQTLSALKLKARVKPAFSTWLLPDRDPCGPKGHPRGGSRHDFSRRSNGGRDNSEAIPHPEYIADWRHHPGNWCTAARSGFAGRCLGRLTKYQSCSSCVMWKECRSKKPLTRLASEANVKVRLCGTSSASRIANPRDGRPGAPCGASARSPSLRPIRFNVVTFFLMPTRF